MVTEKYQLDNLVRLWTIFFLPIKNIPLGNSQNNETPSFETHNRVVLTKKKKKNKSWFACAIKPMWIVVQIANLIKSNDTLISIVWLYCASILTPIVFCLLLWFTHELIQPHTLTYHTFIPLKPVDSSHAIDLCIYTFSHSNLNGNI